MLTSNAETLPKGRFYTEPYIFTVITDGKHYPGAISYIQYGLTDDFTVGLLPSVAWRTDKRDSPIMLGDLKLLTQLRLTHFTPDHRIPTVALVLQETVPIGRHDRLNRPSQGQGSGAFATAVGFNVQHYFRMKNGRLLRARLNFLQNFRHKTDVRDRSVYGTSEGFRGTAKPGAVTTISVAAEYSLTREWVLAFDLAYEAARRTRVEGRAGANDPQLKTELPGSRSFALAPAIEYNWSGNEGILLGVRIIPRQHNMARSITPAIAYSKAW